LARRALVTAVGAADFVEQCAASCVAWSPGLSGLAKRTESADRGPHVNGGTNLATVKDALASMARNIEEKTGVAVPAWLALIEKQRLERHKEIVAWLKKEHGLTHGYANHIALEATKSGYRVKSSSELLDEQYSGAKASLRPIYEKLSRLVTKFGPDIQLEPKKHNVSVRRRRQFALIQPSTTTRVDLGLVLRKSRSTARLEPARAFNAMFTHRVRLTSVDDVDDQLRRWLRAAYDEAS